MTGTKIILRSSASELSSSHLVDKTLWSEVNDLFPTATKEDSILLGHSEMHIWKHLCWARCHEKKNEIIMVGEYAIYRKIRWKKIRTIRGEIKHNGKSSKGQWSQIEELPKSFMEEVLFNLDLEQFIHKYLVSFLWRNSGACVPCTTVAGDQQSPLRRNFLQCGVQKLRHTLP